MGSDLTFACESEEIASLETTFPLAEAAVDDFRYNPVRDLRKRRNARSITGQLTSIHTNVIHVFESLGEMRHAIICDADWHVLRLETQPQRLRLADGRTYTPDAKVWMRGSSRPILRELKPVKWLTKNPDLNGKLDLIASACEAEGCDFEIVSDVWCNREPRLHNALWIRRATKHAPEAHLRHIAAMLLQHGTLIASEISSRGGLGSHGVLAAYALAGLRFCRVDIDQPFDAATVFIVANS
jgi:hypothetical protein